MQIYLHKQYIQKIFVEQESKWKPALLAKFMMKRRQYVTFFEHFI